MAWRTPPAVNAPPLADLGTGPTHVRAVPPFNEMAVDVITGAPFAGKNLYIASEISRREAADEIGLVAIDFTGIFAAVIPGKQSQLRDRDLADTGASRLAGTLYNVAVATVADRGLSGFVATNSPVRALEIAGRFEGRVLNIDLGAEDLASRIEEHMTGLEREVKRAARGRVVRRCIDGAVRYLRERPQLVGRSRNVAKRGKKWVDAGPTLAFDRDLFRRGLTPDGLEVAAELEADGFIEWHPADILRRLLLAR